MINLGRPDISASDVLRVVRALTSGRLVAGPEIERFERLFARVQGCEFAVAVNSGTTAISLMLQAGGIQSGDEVIVPSFSWVATANAVRALGAVPVFCDLGDEGFLAVEERVRERLTPRTKAVLVVHQFGEILDTTPFRVALEEHGVEIFEDAACAVGSKIGNKMAGSLGKAASFSLHPRKVVTTGEGGVVCTSDPELAERVRRLRNHGIDTNIRGQLQGHRVTNLDAFSTVGYNYRMSEVSAALGTSQLRRLDKMLRRRSRIAAIYQNMLAEERWMTLPAVRAQSQPSWQSFVISLRGDFENEQTNLIRFLHQKGIEASIGSVSIHETPAYREKQISLPLTERAFRRSVALPMHSVMKDRHAFSVVNALKQFGQRHLR